MKITILTFFLSLYTMVIAAQDPPAVNAHDTLFADELNEVVISANRSSSVQLKTPEAIKVLYNSSVMDYQLRTAPEALTLLPGVFVQKTNHGGGSPFLRGLTGNQTLLMIDGIRLSNSTMRYGPNQYFNTIDVFSLEKIEVLQGSGSVQYGSDALGGTVQAFSRELLPGEKLKWGGSFLTRISTQGMEQSLNPRINFSTKSIALTAGYTYRNFGDIIGGDSTGRQRPSGYKESDFDVKGKIIISKSSAVTMLYQNVHQADVPIYHKIALEDYAVNKTDPQKRQLAYLRLNQEINKGLLKSVIVTVSYQHTGEGRETQKNGSGILRTEYDKVRTLAFSAELNTNDNKKWNATTGFEAYNDLVNSSRTDTDLSDGTVTEKRGLYPDGAIMTSLAAFSIHTLDLEKWSITAGARFNSFIIKVEDAVLGRTKLSPSAVVGNLAVLRKLAPSTSLFASVNTGFRAPNIDDLGTLGIVDFRYETPNFNLGPESSVQYQIGYKHQTAKLKGDIFLYRNELRDLIVRNRVGDQTIEGYPLYQKENSEKAYIQGIETAWAYYPGKRLTFSGNITYTYGQNVTKSEPVRRIPPVFGRFAADYKLRSWRINVEWLAAGKQVRLAQGDKDDNRIPDGGTPGWEVINIYSGYRWKSITIDLSVKNLFNVDYRYHGSGVNGYGRSAFLTAIFSI
jgi:outer membrane receptor protein involved in Fe transport